MDTTALRAFADFLDFNVNEAEEEKVLVAPQSSWDDRWLHGKGQWTLEVRSKRTDEVVWASMLPRSEATIDALREGSRADQEYNAFQAGFSLGRQNQQLPGPYGNRLRNAFERWKR